MTAHQLACLLVVLSEAERAASFAEAVNNDPENGFFFEELEGMTEVIKRTRAAFSL